jgi:peptidoglycan/xylan/chitin deacetylase (PgdA/CDA1 family)
MFPARSPLFFALAAVLLLPSCQVAGPSASHQGSWRKGYDRANAKYAAKPGWNQAPALPSSPSYPQTTYSSVPLSQPFIAMTFDDGPHPSNTPRLLDLLKQRNIKATFFVVGSNSKAYPQILRRITAEGHEIANHTWTHANITTLSTDALRKELRDSCDAIVKAAGVTPTLFRPPYGATNASIKSLIKTEFGYPSIIWSVDPEDWKRPGVQVVADRLVAGARPGAILLAHDIHKPTIDAMPSALDRLLAKGFRFVTVSQLIALGQKSGTPAP